MQFSPALEGNTNLADDITSARLCATSDLYALKLAIVAGCTPVYVGPRPPALPTVLDHSDLYIWAQSRDHLSLVLERLSEAQLRRWRMRMQYWCAAFSTVTSSVSSLDVDDAKGRETTEGSSPIGQGIEGAAPIGWKEMVLLEVASRVPRLHARAHVLMRQFRDAHALHVASSATAIGAEGARGESSPNSVPQSPLGKSTPGANDKDEHDDIDTKKIFQGENKGDDVGDSSGIKAAANQDREEGENNGDNGGGSSEKRAVANQDSEEGEVSDDDHKEDNAGAHVRKWELVVDGRVFAGTTLPGNANGYGYMPLGLFDDGSAEEYAGAVGKARKAVQSIVPGAEVAVAR